MTHEVVPSLEDAALIVGRDLYARAHALFQANDYLGAIKAWEQVLLLMPEKEAELRVQLAHAHMSAYRENRDTNHLQKAREFLQAQLVGLAPDDSTRWDIGMELKGVEEVLDTRHKEDLKAQGERDEAIRQEQIRLNRQVLAEAEAKHQRSLRNLHSGVGGSLLALGGGSFAAMTVFLVRGENLDKEGRSLADTSGVSPDTYEELIFKGKVQNRAAVATGIIGGVLLAVGGGLLVASIRSLRGTSHRKRVAVLPTPGEMQVHF